MDSKASKRTNQTVYRCTYWYRYRFAHPWLRHCWQPRSRAKYRFRCFWSRLWWLNYCFRPPPPHRLRTALPVYSSRQRGANADAVRSCWRSSTDWDRIPPPRDGAAAEEGAAVRLPNSWKDYFARAQPRRGSSWCSSFGGDESYWMKAAALGRSCWCWRGCCWRWTSSCWRRCRMPDMGSCRNVGVLRRCCFGIDASTRWNSVLDEVLVTRRSCSRCWSSLNRWIGSTSLTGQRAGCLSGLQWEK